MITTRTTSGTGTIPAGVAVSGATVTTNAVDDTILTVSGITADQLRTAVTFKQNNWLYIPATNTLRKIVGLSGRLNIRVDAATAGVAAQPFQIVIGNLYSYIINNTGASAGLVNGGSLPANDIFENTAREYPTNAVKDVITFDATGTTFVINEEVL